MEFPTVIDNNAVENYETLCGLLDEKGWNYDKDDKKLRIKSGVQGEDLPITFSVRVNKLNQIITFISKLPFIVPENKTHDIAMACCMINNVLADGSFDFDIYKGEIKFRLTASFRETKVSKHIFDYMIMIAASTIDMYNDRFLLMINDKFTLAELEEFIEGTLNK